MDRLSPAKGRPLDGKLDYLRPGGNQCDYRNQLKAFYIRADFEG